MSEMVMHGFPRPVEGVSASFTTNRCARAINKADCLLRKLFWTKLAECPEEKKARLA